MDNVANFVSREAAINRAIDDDVKAIVSQKNFDLPRSDTALVRYYVDKIQGTYDVERAKRDTDNAIDLLYIAYNTTPQEEGDVRVRISSIMNKLITAQQNSEITMRRAMDVAGSIGHQIADLFPDWLDVRETDDQSEVKSFVSSDLIKLAVKIRDKALNVRDDLLRIAASYDAIIQDTVQTTDKSETVLSKRLADKAAVEKEIVEANARREQLESLVSDLKEQVAAFEKKAAEFERRANTAEQRAFVMSIVRVGAQMISAAIPAIAMVSGGPASMLAASAGGALSSQGKNGQDEGGGATGGAAGKGGATQDSAAKQSELSQIKGALRTSEQKRDEILSDIKSLEGEKSALVDQVEGSKSTGGKDAELAALERRLKARQTELASQEAAVAKYSEMVSSLQASLDALDKGLGKLTDEQQQQASSLREMQMQMIEKAEAYEKERRAQASELVKINALLKGKQTEDDKIQLALQSLNVSLSALKRMKEIVEEVAFFFKTFADFMEALAGDAKAQIDNLERVSERDVIRANALAKLIASVDEFFVRQTGQWSAVVVVCDRFTRGFSEGWTKLNKLSGTYLTSDKLKAYLSEASAKLSEIVAEREAAADEKIASLQMYRENLKKSA